MYLSRIQLHLERLQPAMLQKWTHTMPYASHQWLWQLFPDSSERHFLFRQEPQARFFMLSQVAPAQQHTLFTIETKPFSPTLSEGQQLDFQLRANPVVCRDKKRSDVLMNAKFQAKAQGIASEKWWGLQVDAAQAWLEKQGVQHGFRLVAPAVDDFAVWADPDGTDELASPGVSVLAYQQHRFQRRQGESPIAYSSVDYAGSLVITDSARFTEALFNGIGKSKSLGCGMLMVKRRR